MLCDMMEKVTIYDEFETSCILDCETTEIFTLYSMTDSDEAPVDECKIITEGGSDEVSQSMFSSCLGQHIYIGHS